MNHDQSGRRGAFVYAAVVMVGATWIAALLYGMNLSVGDRRAWAFIMAVMWIPTLERSIRTGILRFL